MATKGRSVSDFIEQFGSGCSWKTIGLIMGGGWHCSAIVAAAEVLGLVFPSWCHVFVREPFSGSCFCRGSSD